MPTLITKLTELKTPCICIVFDKESDAKTNEDLILKFSRDIYSIMFMPVQGNSMNIMLSSQNQQRLYRNIKYESSALYWWFRYTRFDRQFKFVHLLKRDNGTTNFVNCSNGNIFSLNLKSYVLKSEDDFFT